MEVVFTHTVTHAHIRTSSRYCGISSLSRLEVATEISEGFKMQALPGGENTSGTVYIL